MTIFFQDDFLYLNIHIFNLDEIKATPNNISLYFNVRRGVIDATAYEGDYYRGYR